jgi:plastocyanin
LKNSFLYLVSLLFLFLLLNLQEALANQTISGQVSVEGNRNVSKIVIYLESKTNTYSKPPSAHIIEQRRLKFVPSLKIIVKGDLVKFLNLEKRQIDHNIYSLSEVNTFDLGLGEKGTTLEKKFIQPGVLNFYCSVHKHMEGRLVILPSHYFEVLKNPGTFEIKNIPPGEWILKAVLFHRRYKLDPIEIKLANKDLKNIKLSIVKK